MDPQIQQHEITPIRFPTDFSTAILLVTTMIFSMIDHPLNRHGSRSAVRINYLYI